MEHAVLGETHTVSSRTEARLKPKFGLADVRACNTPSGSPAPTSPERESGSVAAEAPDDVLVAEEPPRERKGPRGRKRKSEETERQKKAKAQ